MQKYVEFNPVKFLKESKTWSGEIKRLEAELASLTELSGQKENVGGRGSGTSDRTGQVVVKRDVIRSQIGRYEFYKKVLDYTLNHITGVHREVIEAFYIKSGYVTSNARKVAEKYYIDYPKGIYKVRREAMEEFVDVITDHFL